MKLVVMTTCREPSTIAHTLASVFASDWDGPVTVSADPTGRAQMRHLSHHRRVDLNVWPAEEWDRVRRSRVHRRAGAHYCRCLEMILRDPDGGVILEDDVVVRDDFLRETRQLMARTRDRMGDCDYALLLYSSRNPELIGLSGRVSEMKPELFFGTQAIYWTPEAAAAVLPWLQEQAVEKDVSVYDLLIRRYALDHNRPVFVLPSESVAQHVGGETTGMGAFHYSPTFASGVDVKQSRVCMLTAGIGTTWSSWALRLVDRWRQLNPRHGACAVTELPTWLPCQLPAISWLKIWGWELVPAWCETLFWVDADTIPLRAVDPLPPGSLCAVPDARTSASYARRAMPALDPERVYYNAGIWIARRPARPLFEALKQLLVSGAWRGQPFYEQSFVNLLLQYMPIKTTPLPREYNWMSAFGNPSTRTRLVHRAGSHSGIDEWWRKADDLFKSGEAFKTAPLFPQRQHRVDRCLDRYDRPDRKPPHPPKQLSKPQDKRG